MMLYQQHQTQCLHEDSHTTSHPKEGGQVPKTGLESRGSEPIPEDMAPCLLHVAPPYRCPRTGSLLLHLVSDLTNPHPSTQRPFIRITSSLLHILCGPKGPCDTTSSSPTASHFLPQAVHPLSSHWVHRSPPHKHGAQVHPRALGVLTQRHWVWGPGSGVCAKLGSPVTGCLLWGPPVWTCSPSLLGSGCQPFPIWYGIRVSTAFSVTPRVLGSPTFWINLTTCLLYP